MNGGMSGNVFVDHLLAEHRRLDHMVYQTLAMLPNWEEPSSPGWTEQMLTGLQSIRRELSRHFQEEETGGCLEEAVVRCPTLCSEVARAKAEHAHLLQDLEEVIEHCRRAAGPSAFDAHVVGQELRAVVHQLRAHEALEDRIIEQGFNVCLENEDMAEPRGASDSGGRPNAASSRYSEAE